MTKRCLHVAQTIISGYHQPYTLECDGITTGMSWYLRNVSASAIGISWHGHRNVLLPSKVVLRSLQCQIQFIIFTPHRPTILTLALLAFRLDTCACDTVDSDSYAMPVAFPIPSGSSLEKLSEVNVVDSLYS